MRKITGVYLSSKEAYPELGSTMNCLISAVSVIPIWGTRTEANQRIASIHFFIDLKRDQHLHKLCERRGPPMEYLAYSLLYLCAHALVAQLDRVLDSGSKGRRFESSRAHKPVYVK